MEEIPPVGVFHPMETEVSKHDFDVTYDNEKFIESGVEPVSETLDVIG